MRLPLVLLLTLAACAPVRRSPSTSAAVTATPSNDSTIPEPPAPPPPTLRDLALAFELPPPEAADLPVVPELWSTHYHLWLADEVLPETPESFVVLDPDDQPYPTDAPLHLTGRDWCYAALEGSARVRRTDGTSLTINYAAQGDVAVPCETWLGPRWQSQGRVRFGAAGGPFGDGVRGWELVPYRTLAARDELARSVRGLRDAMPSLGLGHVSRHAPVGPPRPPAAQPHGPRSQIRPALLAVDSDQETIPYGAAVFVPAAVGDAFEHEGVAYTHDGWFFAADTGGAIKDHHVDTFTGTATASQLDHVRDSPKAERFEARLVPADDPVAEVLAALHRGE